MKKFKFIFSLILIISFSLFSGCTKKDLLNDPVSGEIISSDTSAPINDGHFSASTEYLDSRGYRQELSIFVNKGLMTKVDFKEIDKNGILREEMKNSSDIWPQSENLSLGSIYHHLTSSFILKQSPKGIDSISGATETTERFKKLAEAAYTQSLNNSETIVTVPTNETYTIKGTVDSEGFQGILTASYHDEKLVSLTYDEIRIEDGHFKSKLTENETTLNYKTLFTDLTNQTLATQNLSPVFPDLDVVPEKQKYLEVLNILKEFRISR